jgi:hypothetical protein
VTLVVAEQAVREDCLAWLEACDVACDWVEQGFLARRPWLVGQPQLLGELGHVGDLGRDEASVNHGFVAGNHDIVFVDLREQGFKLLR